MSSTGGISPGSLDNHLDCLAHSWLAHHRHGHTVAITATTNEHVDAVNHAIQAAWSLPASSSPGLRPGSPGVSGCALEMSW